MVACKYSCVANVPVNESNAGGSVCARRAASAASISAREVPGSMAGSSAPPAPPAGATAADAIERAPTDANETERALVR
jgi:hypothetical protein